MKEDKRYGPFIYRKGGKKIKLYMRIGSYPNGNLAIVLTRANGELYADLTTNLGEELPENQVYMKYTNDSSGDENFAGWIEDLGVGHWMGLITPAGYNHYKLMALDLEKVKALEEK